ncbi:putative transcriptional regulatory protein [Psilocybe cubensis]|uniref:Transcriptional regulatory protein n=1 Tax=Psilocybe cubensis TaxID=181762 RepID=A0ACB8HB60_PSICU|nr:putative transcriptional regulatory protein [Psilocybe cubensis]KAH9485168.1 putative transcriptional regulatory protein [Psilocybe cubensis]
MPRQPKKTETQQAYIMVLEERIEKLEAYIRKMHPGEDIDHILSIPPDKIAQVPSIPNLASVSSTETNLSSFAFSDLKYAIPVSISSDTTPPPLVENDSEILEADDLAHVALAEHLGRLSLSAVDDRFFGQASAFMFAKDAANVKSSITGESSAPDIRNYRRPLFWDMRPWELTFATSPETSYVYPEDDLLQSLISLYFDKVNCVLPVLHQPTFMKSLSIGQHHWDPSFGMIVLLVCAIGSRYSHDHRVTVPNDASGLSSGWHYFCQVPIHRKIMLYKANIHDLQYYCLAPLYLVGTSMPHAAWNILGIGIRYALEKGAHRRKGQNQKPTVEDELRKRAFWCMICLDRLINSFVGRQCGLPHEAFDVEYPIDCDDEYWETEDPEQAFKQPTGKPSMITGFICFIKLCEILGFALRTLYTTKKSKLLSGFIGSEWEGRMVAELDSAMNGWKDSLPPHLRWDPNTQNPAFFSQSVNLNSTFFYVQIQIHRPFLTKKSPLSFPSLAMCTNAARSCTHVLEAGMTRGLCILPNTMTAAFTAGIIIALGLWSGQRSGYISDPEKERQSLQKCLNVLEYAEKRDMLREVSAIQEYHPTDISKRRHDSIEGSPESEATTLHQSLEATLPSSVVTEPVNESTLRKLLLTEMGYVFGDPNEILLGTTESCAQSNQDFMSSSSQSPPSQSNELPSVNDMFALWSDIPTAFSCFEEWDAYLSSVGQS